MNLNHTLNSAPIAVIGAMPEETRLLIESLDDACMVECAGIKINSGTINGVSVIIAQSGIGKVNASIATTLIIERFSPKAVINTGSAGGIGANLSIGDVVIGKNVTHHDVDVTAFGYSIGQMAQMPEYYTGDSRLLSIAEQCAQTFSSANIRRGQIVSGDQFISSTQQFENIKNAFPQALAVEMEAASIAQACYRFDVPSVVIRAISDLANEQSAVSFEEFILTAGKHSAEMVINMLEKI